MKRATKPLQIEFICEDPSLSYFDPPIAADKVLPEWYKKIPSYTGPKTFTANGANGTVKKCMPVFDVMTSGYLITLPCDVLVELDAVGLPNFTWPIEWKLVTEHDVAQVSTMTIPTEFHPRVFKWSNAWIVKTPEGWSSLFISPAHRDDLPFEILSGVVDTDGFELSIQFPFMIKKGFSGVIKKGTPIAQIIPIKRNEWESSVSVLPEGQRTKNLQKHSRTFENRYKKTFWNKKDYR